MVGARRASALFETGVLEMRIDWRVLEGGVVPCTVLLEFLGGEKKQCRADTAPVGVGGSTVGAKWCLQPLYGSFCLFPFLL